MTELLLIRHAPVAEPGRLYGRTDVAAATNKVGEVVVAQPGTLITSPALRCRQTAEALWPATAIIQDDRLWEQDFGDHDGLPFGDLPDLGVMSNDALADYAAPGGESFNAVAARIAPALIEWAKRPNPVLVVHAGVIRAALGLALGHPPAGLAFAVDNLSVTRITVGPDGPFAVGCVNAQA